MCLFFLIAILRKTLIASPVALSKGHPERGGGALVERMRGSLNGDVTGDKSVACPVG